MRSPVCREHGISAATFYGWKSKYGGMEVSEAQRLKAVEDETPVFKRQRSGNEALMRFPVYSVYVR